MKLFSAKVRKILIGCIGCWWFSLQFRFLLNK
nr:MAG TPA: hypothetical protein [Caudoviricetes sp.]